MNLTRDACQLLNSGSPTAAKLASFLLNHTELLSTKGEAPLVWFSTVAFTNQRLTESLRFGMLEIGEHMETFLDKKDHATEVGLTIFISSFLHNQNETTGT